MKEETKKVLLYKPSEMLAVDIKPLKFLDAELLCLIRQPAVRAKRKCRWFQLADAARSHQVTVPVTLPLSRAALVSPCWWISLPSPASLLQERSARGAWVWRLLGISSASDVSKAENITNFCSAWCFQEWSVYLPCFLENATVHIHQLLINAPSIYLVEICLYFVSYLSLWGALNQRYIRQGRSILTPSGKFRAAVRALSETCENPRLRWVELVAEYFLLLPLNSFKDCRNVIMDCHPEQLTFCQAQTQGHDCKRTPCVCHLTDTRQAGSTGIGCCHTVCCSPVACRTCSFPNDSIFK